MSLDLYLMGPPRVELCNCERCGHEHTREKRDRLFETNITHNLGRMFAEVGVYNVLWRGTGKRAGDVLPQLRDGLRQLQEEGDRLRAFDASNGWGTYEQALPWLREVVKAFEANPEGELRCST